MTRFLLPLIVLGLISGCCSSRRSPCEGCRPPLNCSGLAYDGSGSPCYRPPGPFWMCLPGPCSRCNDPWVECYDTSCWADISQRHVCNDRLPPNSMPYGGSMIEPGHAATAVPYGDGDDE